MASVDIRKKATSRKDALGLSFLLAHTGIGGFVLAGWLIASYETLLIYLVLLPTMAAQWVVNQRSCIINNLESWIRTGQWRDPRNPEEGGFVLMLCEALFDARPSPTRIDHCSYCVVAFLWFLGIGHLWSL